MSSRVFDSFLLEFFTCAQLFFGAGKGRLGDVVAAVHPSKLLLASLKVEREHVRIGPAAALLLADKIVVVRHRGDLRQMRHAHYLLAERHADLADEMSLTEKDPRRAAELRQIAEVCRWVPAHAPRTYWEAIQMYWFVHLGTITELNGWDAMNPGHFDQHLAPFYEKEIAAGTLTRDEAKELMSCFFIKVNNHTAPPKVGITAKESGTYNNFTNLNIGGILADGSDGVSEVSYIMLETIEELHILQPGSAIHISARTPERFLRAGCKVIRQGHGYPSVFNPDG